MNRPVGDGPAEVCEPFLTRKPRHTAPLAVEGVGTSYLTPRPARRPGVEPIPDGESTTNP